MNSFLQNSGQVIFYQFLVIAITMLAIWKGQGHRESKCHLDDFLIRASFHDPWSIAVDGYV